MNKNYSSTNFITNQDGYTLLDRISEILPNTKEFDCLVGYLYFNGLKQISQHLDGIDKIRILVGIKADDQLKEFLSDKNNHISDLELKDLYKQDVKQQIEYSDDNYSTEKAILKLRELISSGKLEIRAYKSAKLHAKVYIMTYKEGHDPGIVITGSSNLTQGGLKDNLEFNVQLRDPRDYEYAKDKFEMLWGFSVDITKEIVNAINETHLSDQVTPYHIYLKFLYEYFKEDLEFDESNLKSELGDKFLDFDYQRQAVISALKILKEHGGVILSDVVGLGKTYIAARIAKQLDGNHLVIAPPPLIEKKNPGSWRAIFRDLKISNVDFISSGNLAKFNIEDYDYQNVFIDESHRFRNEDTQSHQILQDICHGKKVILISATPFNNYPKDLLAQIKLFQNTKQSTIPGIPNLDGFFNELDNKLQKADEFEKKIVLQKISKEIRNKVLRYIMIRRTRSEISKFYKEDLAKKHVKFPEIKDPIIVYYDLDTEEEKIFDNTVLLIRKFKYVRYKPLTYLKSGISTLKLTSQENMASFMKTLLIKRFDSSIEAFKNTLERFEKSYERFKENFERGKVYISKESNYKLNVALAEDDYQKIFKLLEEEKIEEYPSTDFREEFYTDLQNDLNIIKEIKKLWTNIKSDPKLEKLLNLLRNDLANKKVIIFTESKETSEYLTKKIKENLHPKVLNFHSSIKNTLNKQAVIENFDNNEKNKKDDYMILVTTEVLAEGVNLHRSNIIINYDIPWNPTRVIQRVGRVNRIGTPFDYIYIYNFFPTSKADDEINLKNNAINKFNMFIELLGTDSKLLTETDEVKSHVLFDTLNSRALFTEDEDFSESELTYLKEIENIKNNNPELFDKIKNLPRKIRSCKESNLLKNSLVSYFKKGNIDKFILYSSESDSAKEIDFFEAVKYIKSNSDEKALQLPDDYYNYLDKNKKFFDSLINKIYYDNEPGTRLRGNASILYRRIETILNKDINLTTIQRNYLKLMIRAFKETSLHKKKIQNALKEIKDSYEGYHVYNILTKYFSEKVLNEKIQFTKNSAEGKRLIILSMFCK